MDAVRQGITRREAIRSLSTAMVWCGPTSSARVDPAQDAPAELLIRQGRVVNADGARNADVRIVGETIAEIGSGLKPGPRARILDAAGRLVLPGGVDPHTHLHSEFVDDLTTGSMAALAGGITTVGTFAHTQKGENLDTAVEREGGRVKTEAIADVFLHGAPWPPTAELNAAMMRLVELGQPSLKVYMQRADFSARLPEFIRQLEVARDAGIVTMMHCEDGVILAAVARRLEAEGRTTLRDYAASRPVVAEAAATQQAATLCESVGGPLYVVHVSSARALDTCRQARRAALPFFVETRPLYLHLTLDRMQGPDAPLYVGQPPLRDSLDREALWRGLADGTIDVLATDHAPWTRAQKLDPSLSITRLRPGMSDLQFMLPMCFSEGVRRRRLPVERFVEVTSTNAARIFGLYPRKGAIREEADADVVIWDPGQTSVVQAARDLSRADYSVYEGWKVTGWPLTTIRRGQIVYDNGQVIARAGTGKLIQRAAWRRALRSPR